MQQRFFFIADLIACSTCFGHHYAHHQELKSIIQWLLPVVFGTVVFKLVVWCGAEGYVSGFQGAALIIIIIIIYIYILLESCKLYSVCSAGRSHNEISI